MALTKEEIKKAITDMGWNELVMTKGGKFTVAMKKYGSIPVFFGPSCAFVYDFAFNGDTSVRHDWANIDDIKGAIRSKTLDIDEPDNLSGLIVINRYDVVAETYSEEDSEYFDFVGITEADCEDIASRLEKMASLLFNIKAVEL